MRDWQHGAVVSGRCSRVRSLLATMCFVACVLTLPSTALADDSMPEQLRNRLIKRVAQTEIVFPETRGFALRVNMPGVGAFSYAEGSAHPFGANELSTNNIYRMASVTKTFSAVAILKLVDQGLLSLEDPVVKYVPACPNGSEITVRDLLSMTSGLADYSSRPEFFTGLLLDPASFAEREVVADLCALEPVSEPGFERVYNNSGYYLLGPIIEEVTGEPWQAWITSNVIEPAGLERTSIPTDAVLPQNAVAGWFYFEAPPEVRLGPWWDLAALHPAYAGTAGCGYSTLEDLTSWAETLLSGALLSPATRAAQFDLQPIDDEKYEFYGLGVAQFGPWIGHTGVTLGSYAWMLKHQPTGTTLVAFVECGSETPHIDLEGLARDLAAWPKLPAE